ncbi:hypothetical protein FPHYL_9615 [Fusarium phyllophilum]|uniref:Uncharacterized protein n=1 Tax=Fusarium phyllophilum TaxID=47803 RepID=A0A8H5J8R7_9HYPO|nr:hypothetical protein FPHYL_9615 [Fusarium phyllophilum]
MDSHRYDERKQMSGSILLTGRSFALSATLKAEMLLPKNFGLQFIKRVRSNRCGRQGPLEKFCCPYGPLQLHTTTGTRVYCFWEYTGEDSRLMWFGITLTDQDEESPGVEDMNPDGDCSEASDVGEDSDSTNGDSTVGGSEYYPSDQDDDEDDEDDDFYTEQNLTIPNSYLAMLVVDETSSAPYPTSVLLNQPHSARFEKNMEMSQSDKTPSVARNQKKELGKRLMPKKPFSLKRKEKRAMMKSRRAGKMASVAKDYETEVNFRKFNAQIQEYLKKMQDINLEDSTDTKSRMKKILSENERKKVGFSEQDEEAMAQALPDDSAFKKWGICRGGEVSMPSCPVSLCKGSDQGASRHQST